MCGNSRAILTVKMVVHLGSAKDVEEAVERAEKAQPAWASLSMAARGEYLRKPADALRKRAAELLCTGVLDTGNTILQHEKRRCHRDGSQ
jgi:acyl-CoA reductase-like NAD-dependent aldehyde dehydrogenase